LFGRNDNPCEYDTLLTLYYLVNDLVHLPNPHISLPRTWRPMVTLITQAKDLNTLTLEVLIGSLRAHEVILQGDKLVRKVKTLALKAFQNFKKPRWCARTRRNRKRSRGRSWGWTCIHLKKIQRMMRRKDQIKRKFPNINANTKTEKSQVNYFGCIKLGHYKSECLELKKLKKKPPFKKRSMMATWMIQKKHKRWRSQHVYDDSVKRWGIGNCL